ncbi:MAG: hypothetical protein AMJ54_05195 [Deltaproteobacteria bacterium SG8_13]|nr:MAG: hypothetical protein AMJ54_05195 [Deltaproteobacteria bacterium SG8_13]
MTVEELEQRWKNALATTQSAVTRHPGEYRELKSLAAEIVARPLDIGDYLPATKKLVALLQKMDPGGKGTIFYFFNKRFAPSSIWDVCWLRLECRDLLAHLAVFDKWHMNTCRLKVVK